MLSTIIEKAKTMFISEKERNIIENTKAQHLESQTIMYRSLEEITSKYYLTNVYEMTEVYANDDSQNVEYYIFHELDFEDSNRIKKKYYENEGILTLVDEEYKKRMNKRFRFEPKKEHYFNKPKLRSTPDFIYEFENQLFWVTLKPIRAEDEEKEHTEVLELLFSALYNTNEIDIGVESDNTFKNTNEKYYDLIHFRLDRNSLFLVIRDKENNEIYHSHEFNHIQHIKFSNIGDRLKFWLYMLDGVNRFYIPYDKEQLNGEHVRIDPLLYKY